MPVRGRAGAAVAVVLVVAGLLPIGCAPRRATGPAPVRLTWHALALPVPDGGPGRLSLRDATACGGRWYVVGAVFGADGSTRPAAWSSADGDSWRPLPTTARTGYGAQNILYAVGCRDGSAAAVGAKSGGAHGNPRVSTWQQAGGGLVEQTAGFELYGGNEAVNVARIAGGPSGWLLAGNRVTGAAVWTAVEGGDFALRAGMPPLAADAAGATWAADAVSGADGGWTLVGAITPAGRIDRDPLAWRSADGITWQRQAVTAGGDNEEFQRVARLGTEVLAAGRRGETFGAWLGRADEWRPVGRFGRLAGSGLPEVRSLATLDGVALASVGDGSQHRLYLSRDGGVAWAQLIHPAEGRPAAVAGAGGRWLVVTEEGGAFTAPARP